MKFRSNFIEIGAKNHEFDGKLTSKFGKISEKLRKFWAEFLQKIEFGAVRKCVHLVDLEKCCKMSIWLQKSASIENEPSQVAGNL